jgi:two-component system, NtrC family, response regulator HydG
MQARLTIERGGAAPLFWKLDTDQIISLGRTRQNTVVLPDATVSRKHAEIYADDGSWYVREAKPEPINGTRINGERIQGPTALHHNDEIAIGSARLRFTLDPSKDETEEFMTGEKDEDPTPRNHDSATNINQTVLHADELTVLLHFMNDSLQETTPRGLIQLALSTVYNQTHAAVAGFLSLDPAEPLPRLIVPASGQVEPQLSRQLTDMVKQTKRSVWLATQRSVTDLDSQSLAGFRDAICVALSPTSALALPNIAQSKHTLAPLGALHVYKNTRPFTEREVQFCELLANSLANNLHVLRERRVLEADILRLRERAATCGQELIGKSAVMEKLRRQIAKLADGPGIILINGESGVGKELVAQALHKLSRRRNEPIVCVNCAAITETLAESELFGHEKDAFSGANSRRAGYFEQADEGTLFLDEIGELSLESQARLLRVLETKKIRRVGGECETEINVRVVVATNRNLKKEADDGNFRRDLVFRLGTTIHVPPLREHIEDVEELAAFFLAKWNAEYHRDVDLSEGALQKLKTFSWPGNVRELRSVLETAVATVEGDLIHAGDLRLLASNEAPGEGPPSLNLEEMEAWAICQVLKRTNSNNTKAAELLGINRDTLINKIRKYGINRKG